MALPIASVVAGALIDPTTFGNELVDAINAAPRGVIALAFPVTAQSGIVATATDLTGFSATWTSVADRRYRVSWVFEMTNTVAGDLIQFDLCNAANSSLMRQLIVAPALVSGSGFTRVHGTFVVTPGAGSYTSKLRGYRNSGTGSFSLTNSSSSGMFLVEDIGT